MINVVYDRFTVMITNYRVEEQYFSTKKSAWTMHVNFKTELIHVIISCLFDGCT